MLQGDAHEQHRRRESLRRIQRDIIEPLEQGIIRSEDVLQAIERAEARHLHAIRMVN